MNRVLGSFLGASFGLLVLLAPGAAEIPTPILHLDLPGSWKETPQWAANVELEEVRAFYDDSTGSLMYVGRSGPMPPAKADELAQGFPQVSKGLLGTGMPETDLQRKLGAAFFLLPDGYMEASGITDLVAGKTVRIKRIWEIKSSKGNVQSFYVSQLTPGMTVEVSNGTATLQMDSAPNKVTRAEKRKFNAGEVLVGELETEKLVSKNIVEWFGLPPTFTDQRVRYTYVCYAPHGFDTSAGTFVIVMGTPVNSGLGVEAILKGLGMPKDSVAKPK